MQELISKYKKQSIQKQSIDIILASFQKYVDSHTSQNQNSYSRESLRQLALFFQKQLSKV